MFVVCCNTCCDVIIYVKKRSITRFFIALDCMRCLILELKNVLVREIILFRDLRVRAYHVSCVAFCLNMGSGAVFHRAGLHAV